MFVPIWYVVASGVLHKLSEYVKELNSALYALTSNIINIANILPTIHSLVAMSISKSVKWFEQ